MLAGLGWGWGWAERQCACPCVGWLQILSFEAYRDMIRYMAGGVSEATGLAKATDELIELRANK